METPFTSHHPAGIAVHPESSVGEVTRQLGTNAQCLILTCTLPTTSIGGSRSPIRRRVLRRSAPPDRVVTSSCDVQTHGVAAGVFFRPGQQREAVMSETRPAAS
jgi:hypothetical protein